MVVGLVFHKAVAVVELAPEVIEEAEDRPGGGK